MQTWLDQEWHWVWDSGVASARTRALSQPLEGESRVGHTSSLRGRPYTSPQSRRWGKSSIALRENAAPAPKKTHLLLFWLIPVLEYGRHGDSESLTFVLSSPWVSYSSERAFSPSALDPSVCPLSLPHCLNLLSARVMQKDCASSTHFSSSAFGVFFWCRQFFFLQAWHLHSVVWNVNSTHFEVCIKHTQPQILWSKAGPDSVGAL